MQANAVEASNALGPMFEAAAAEAADEAAACARAGHALAAMRATLEQGVQYAGALGPAAAQVGGLCAELGAVWRQLGAGAR